MPERRDPGVVGDVLQPAGRVSKSNSSIDRVGERDERADERDARAPSCAAPVAPSSASASGQKSRIERWIVIAQVAAIRK